LRRSWARRMQELLSLSGILVCLEFPLYKDLDAVGPPWGIKGVHWDLLAAGNEGILHEAGSRAEAPPTQRQGQFERVRYYKPEQSYTQGRGTDMLSVWKRRPEESVDTSR